jgi:hypothetical protein
MEISRVGFLRNHILLLFEVFGLSLLLIFVTLIYFNQGIISFFFNSDTLLLPSLLKDLFLHISYYKDWSLSPAPHFFPDIFLYAIIFFVTKNIYFQFLINLYLQLLFLYVAIKYIYRLFFDQEKAVIFAFAAVCLVFLLAIYGKPPFGNMVVPTAHIGEFIIGIYLLGVQLKNIAENRLEIKKHLVILTSTLSFLAGLSDLLFVPQFATAFLLSYLLFFITGSIKFRKIFYNGVFPFCAAIAGAYLTKYAVPTNILFKYLGQPTLEKISLATLHQQFSSFVAMLQTDMRGILCPIYILFYGLLFFVIVYCLIDKKNNRVHKELFFFSIFVFFSAFLSIVAVFCLAGENYVAQKYIYPIYFIPVLSFFCLQNITNRFPVIGKLMLGLAGLLILLLPWNIQLLITKPGFKIKYEYYPEYMACIDHSLKGYGHTGIAGYWEANLITILSKTNVQVVPVQPKNFSIFPWMLNLKKFSNSYSFAIIDVTTPFIDRELDQNMIEAFNGKPRKTIVCAAKKLLIYDEDQLRIPYFSQAGDQFTWPASRLLSQFSDNVVANRRVASETTAAGFLTYGPYIALPEGHYQFSISYSSQAPITTLVAHWDSSLHDIAKAPSKEEILADGALFGTAGRDKTLEGSFFIPKQFAKNVTEVRVFFLGKKNLTVRSLTIKKV